MSFKSISDILGVSPTQKKKFKKGPKDGDVLNFLDLVYGWSEIVGPKLSLHTLPLKNNDNLLTILTDHPVYSQQLSFLEKEIIEKIQRKFPSLSRNLKGLRFQVNAQFFNRKLNQLQKNPQANRKKEVTKLHPLSPEYKKYKREFDGMGLEFEDEELKEIFFSLFIQGKIQ